MTNYEFDLEYAKLEETIPYYTKATVKTLVAGCVHDLDRAWFKNLVERIVLTPGSRIDIGEASKAEKRARQAIKDTKALTEAYTNLRENISDNGLAKVLADMGAKSLMEAVSKGRTNE